MKTHSLDDSHVHTRWNRDLSPALEIESGDVVEMVLRDSSDGQVQPDWTTADLPKLDRLRIHALTGPILVKGAQPGHVLEVSLEAIAHRGWGWTSLIPGLGLLPERFPDPYLFIWKLEEAVTRSLAPAVVPLRPFCGILGVAPNEFGEHRTRPPGVFGGNLDIRQLTAGAKLYLPVQVPGALFSAGDAHAAQGDGEVCINGIEMPCQVRLRFCLHTTFSLVEPRAETPSEEPAQVRAGSWVFIASREDALAAAKSVVNQAIDFLVEKYDLSIEHAYLLCSVALDLRISQWVNVPMVTITGHLSKGLFSNGNTLA